MENDSVKVFLRIRPDLKNASENSPGLYIDQSKNTERMIVVDQAPFAFDHIFYQSSTQQEVFQDLVEPQIEKLLDGFNCSILAYGQSGAGKTFTMGLNDNDKTSSAGMIKMSIDELFLKIGLQGTESTVSVSYIEIYNEKVYDLLSEKCQESIYSRGAKFNGSTKLPIDSSHAAKLILQQGNKNRHVRETKLNDVSSRSHAMFSIFVTTRKDGFESSAVMHVSDLAGSEGMRHTQHTGIAQQESANINRGLLAVSKVVQALSTGNSVIPYRDSVLTVVLQDSLNVRSYISILGCISPCRKDKNETMSTIRFAQSVKTLDNKNVPELNAYLNEKQNLQAKTPHRSYMMPLAPRNERAKTPGRIQDSKTPGRMLPPPSTNKNTLTIKRRPIAAASRFQSFTTPSKSPNRQRTPLRKTEVPRSIDMSLMQQTIGSVDNNTFSILNMSTSTEVDGPPILTPARDRNQTMMSFSPFMREIEKTMDNKFSTFMKTLNESRQPTAMDNEGLADENGGEPGMMNSTFDLLGGYNQATSTILRQPLQARTNQLNMTLSTFGQAASKRNLCLTKTRLETTVIGAEVTPIEIEANRRFTTAVGIDNNETVIVQDERPVRRSSRISHTLAQRRSIVNSSVDARQAPVGSKRGGARPVIYEEDMENITKSAHKKRILRVLNTAHFKEIKKLSTIGPKTAYQIVSHRAINEKFKDLVDLKKLPAMKGKMYQKFMEGNMLT